MHLKDTQHKTDFTAIARQIVLDELINTNVKCFLFGSRATGTHHKFSDLDIGLISDKEIPVLLYSNLYDKLNESIVPFKIDLVNFNMVPLNFKQIAMQNIIYWKN